MADFDAELYLRLAGERMLLDGGEANQGWWQAPVGDAASALVAVGAIEAGPAQEIVDDYSMALAVRNEGQLRHLSMLRQFNQPPGQPAPALKPRRTVPCDRVIESAAGTLHIRSVMLAEDSTRLAINFRPTGSAPHPTSPRAAMMLMASGGWGGGGPPDVDLTDDRGTTTTATFGGGGGGDGWWSGHLQADDQPLATDTAWIEVDGERIELIGEPPPVEVEVEALPDEDPALRHLAQRLASAEQLHQPPGSLDAAIDALVACGALATDDPALAGLRAVSEALGHGQLQGGSGRSLPEPWRSLTARRGRANGPTGTIVIGAVTPEFEGISAAVHSLDSTAEAFAIEVEVAGLGSRSRAGTDVDRASLAWWAADDRGNRYLGQLTNWGGDHDSLSGTVEFWPALDPKAARLELLPTADRTRAVIRVPLSWGAGG